MSMKHDQTSTAVASLPPLTNRGVLTPLVSPVMKGFDYLRLTVFSDIHLVLNTVEWVMEQHAVISFEGFTSAGPARRIDERFTCGVPGLEVHRCDGYCGVLIKGQGCTDLGQLVVLAIINAFGDTRERWHATRVDLAWDGCPFTPADFFAKLKAGDVNTRAHFTAWPYGDLSEHGATCYTHVNPEKRGVERYARVYDLREEGRGASRFELVVRGDHAARLGRSLVGVLTVEQLQPLAESYVRGWADLVEEGDGRVDRRDLWGPWSAVFRDAPRWTPAADRERVEVRDIEQVGAVDAAVMRSSKALLEAVEAFGGEWLLERLKFHAADRIDPERVARLKRIRAGAAARRLGGIPAWPEERDDLPF